MATELAANAGFTGDNKLSVVPRQHVFHDGETETDAAIVTATPFINAEKPFRQARNMFGVDAFASVRDDQVRSICVGVPADRYYTVCRRVTDCVGQEIHDNRFYFGAIALQFRAADCLR